MSIGDGVEIFLVINQFLAGLLFLIAAVEAFVRGTVFPKGPMRSIFQRLGVGFLFFGLMAINWVFEDMVPILDTVTDVLFTFGLIISLWGFVGVLGLKLDVGGD